MAGYMEGYGVEGAQRERIFKWVFLIGGALAFIALLLWLSGVGRLLADWIYSIPAKSKVSRLLDDLHKKDYRAAYKEWGCPAGSVCADYTFDKFMEDWGPKGEHPDAAGAQIKKARYCGTGVIVTLGFPSADDLPLWYERKDSTLGFSPWPVCVPQPKAWR